MAMFTAALYTVAKRGEITHLSTDGWIHKMCIYKKEDYSTIKRNKVLIPVTKWMNRENTMLSERGQAQKDRYCMITFK